MALPFMPLLLKLKFKIFKVLCFFDFCVKGNSLETSLKQFLFKSYHPQPSFLYTLNQFLTIFTRSVAGAAGHGSFSPPPSRVFLLSTFLPKFFLCQDRCHGDVLLHLTQPCYVALGRALDSGLIYSCSCWNSNLGP